MAQNEQSPSHSSASLTRATGLVGLGRAAKRSPAGAGNTSGSARRSAGISGAEAPPGETSGRARLAGGAGGSPRSGGAAAGAGLAAPSAAVAAPRAARQI